MGVTDWDFLKTRRQSEEDATQGKVVIKRPCLEDFDGELAVFAVCAAAVCCSSMLFHSSNECSVSRSLGCATFTNTDFARY